MNDNIVVSQEEHKKALRGTIRFGPAILPPLTDGGRLGERKPGAWVKVDPAYFSSQNTIWPGPCVVPPDEASQATSRILADDDKRGDYPLYDGLFAYFPAALLEVSRWSKIGNDKWNPGEKLHWSREKSDDHENKILRHLLDAREVDQHGFPEAVALAWRALALCQTILEERGWAEGANAKRKKEQQ